MSDVRKWLHRLLVATRDDLAAQRRLAELLTRQEDQVVGRSPDELAATTEAIRDELAGAPRRRRNREAALEALAAAWGVPRHAMTLASVAERAGEDAAQLVEAGRELRTATEHVVRRNRRVAALLGLHRRVNQELFEVLLADDQGNPMERAGALVDAEV